MKWGKRELKKLLVVALTVVLATLGCTFSGQNSLPPAKDFQTKQPERAAPKKEVSFSKAFETVFDLERARALPKQDAERRVLDKSSSVEFLPQALLALRSEKT